MRQRILHLLAVACLSVAVSLQSALACPFCTALEPTLSQRREAAAVVLLAEVTQATKARATCRVHRALKGEDRIGDRKSLEFPSDAPLKPGSLVLLFGVGDAETKPEDLAWTSVVVDEASYASFARAPALRTPTAERLKYFVPLLEHPNKLIAEDAYLEFGHAPFDEVARAADLLPMAKIRGWLSDEKISPQHKGFYGLALGLAKGGADRQANAALLEQQILAPADDFRAGFDGVLGGYLLLTGKAGLKMIEDRYLANPKAAVGDVRHAMTALRFYHEFGHEIPVAQLRPALARLLARPEFAELAIIDLTRWQAWESLEQIAALYAQPAYQDTGTRRAIVGYLGACPAPAAATWLAKLRTTDPEGVAAAEEVLSKLSGTK